jgi:serine/threonine-protein kinase
MGLLVQHAQSAPPPPSTRTDHEIPDALDRLILSCLSKEPGARPQTARELSERLAEIDVGGEWTQERAREWWKAAGVPAH